MRTALAILAALFVLAACSGEDAAAARKKKIDGYKAQLKVLNGQLAEMMPQHTEIKTTSYKAQAALKAAKKKGDEAAVEAAQAAYDEASGAANDALAQEKALDDQMTALRDKIYDLGGTP